MFEIQKLYSFKSSYVSLPAYWCTMSPVVISQGKWSLAHDASVCLTDAYADNLDGWPYNYWSGKNYQAANFQIDLGCRARITMIHLRNSHNGKYCNRSVDLINMQESPKRWALAYDNFAGKARQKLAIKSSRNITPKI